MTQGTSALPPPLNYAPKNWRRGRTWARRSLIGIALLAIVALCWHFAPHTWRFARIWYWERQCMNFATPPGTVAYQRLALGSAKTPVDISYMSGDDPQVMALRGHHGCLLPQYHPVTITSQDPICWVRFLQSSGNPRWFREFSTLIFCHERISPSGNSRLVTVEFPRSEDGADMPTPITSDGALAYRSPTWAGSAPIIAATAAGGHMPGPMLGVIVRIFAGQPDPQDASHFTIEYQRADGGSGIIDGYLRDDDTVDVGVRPVTGGAASEEKGAFGP